MRDSKENESVVLTPRHKAVIPITVRDETGVRLTLFEIKNPFKQCAGVGQPANLDGNVAFCPSGCGEVFDPNDPAGEISRARAKEREENFKAEVRKRNPTIRGVQTGGNFNEDRSAFFGGEKRNLRG